MTFLKSELQLETNPGMHLAASNGHDILVVFVPPYWNICTRSNSQVALAVLSLPYKYVVSITHRLHAFKISKLTANATKESHERTYSTSFDCCPNVKPINVYGAGCFQNKDVVQVKYANFAIRAICITRYPTDDDALY